MSDSDIHWSDEYRRYYRYVYNQSTQSWDIDWNAKPQDNRRDSGGLPNQGSPTTSGATAWPTDQQSYTSYNASTVSNYPIQSYAGPATVQLGAYDSSSYVATNSAQYTVATDSQLSANNYLAPTISGAASRLPRGKGKPINGEYAPGRPEHEKLDSSYKVRPSSFFGEGKVFAVMWSETAGATHKPVDYNTSRSLSEVKHEGHIVYTNVRRFVVVRRKREFCYACPIFTYSGQGCKKNGVRASEHAIAYSWNSTPQYVSGETGITKPSIAVVNAPGVANLHLASRIYFGIHHPIQYNVKVKDIGYVPATQVPTLISNWTEEDQGTNQAADVTADAN